MGTTEILSAFNQQGKVSASAARLRYDHSAGPNMQVLEFDGQGGPFVSEPFMGNPIDKAREMAAKLSEAPGASPPGNPQ